METKTVVPNTAITTDDALIAKIFTEAGRTNVNFLSDTEAQRTKELLADETRILSHLEREVEVLISKRDKQRERVAEFRAAIAPHKRVPPEILSNIFVACLTVDYDDYMTIPPKVSQAPWLLGQVCSRWRQISRNEPRLWGCFEIDDIQQLGRACSLFPPAVFCSVEVAKVIDIHMVTKKIIPHLPRIQRLILRMDPASFDKLWTTIPSHSLTTLESADFDISGAGCSDDEQYVTRWKHAKPFQLATKLKELTLHAPQAFSEALLSLDIPWSQLSSVNLAGMQNLPLGEVLEYIEKCPELEELCFSLDRDDHSYFPEHTVELPSLRHLKLKGTTPDALIDWKALWNNLSTLDLMYVSFDDSHVLYNILKQCHGLIDLKLGHLPHMPSGYSGIDGTLHFPCLTALRVICFADPWLLSSLMTPRLTKLNALLNNSSESVALYDMIVSSKCSLRSLRLQLQYSLEFHEEGSGLVGDSGLYDVLDSSPQLTELTLFGGLCVDNDVLQAIGIGQLLPQVEDLFMQTVPLAAFAEMVETRARHESQQGRRILHKVTTISPVLAADRAIDEAAISRLREVIDMYGIECHVGPTPGAECFSD